MASAVGDLVDAEAVEAVEPGVVEMVGHDPGQAGVDRLPGDPQEPGQAGLVHPLRQPGHDVVEVAGEPGPGSGPGHILDPHLLTARAPDPGQLGTQPDLGDTEVEVSPGPRRLVVAGVGGEPARAAVDPPARGDVEDQPVGGGMDGLH